MSAPARGTPYGATAWHQTSWDWRAAGNFIGGGAGAGVIVFAALSPASGLAQSALFLAGIALVGLGLASVALELGRPLRALNVFRNPRTSWMSREALVGAALTVACVAAAAGVPAWRWAAALLALAFVYCQGRLLQGARGIPAWRDPLLVPLIVLTGLVEGGGIFWLAAALHRSGSLFLLGLFAVLVALRAWIWRTYRARLSATIAGAARTALDGAGRLLMLAGTWPPLVLIAIAIALPPGTLPTLLAALAGLMAAVAGSLTKFALVTRAGFNQGFALPQLPVRGARP